MKLIVDTDARTITRQTDAELTTSELYSSESFEWLSDQWLKVGWMCQYYQTFTWFGRPVIQLPEDLLRIQEVIHQVRPIVIVETGVAYGGSLLFYASLLKLTGGRLVIGVDLQFQPESRRAIEQHELAPFITLVEGNSVEPAVVDMVRSHIAETDRVLVVLDSCHTKSHVGAELEAYHSFVTPGSYIVATDGITRELSDLPGGAPGWQWDNPAAAAADFAATHPKFLLEPPKWTFNESVLNKPVTYWPQAWLRYGG
jgi:cephalosporin hydroxylase